MIKSYSDKIHKAGLGHAYTEKIKIRRHRQKVDIRKGKKNEEERRKGHKKTV